MPATSSATQRAPSYVCAYRCQHILTPVCIQAEWVCREAACGGCSQPHPRRTEYSRRNRVNSHTGVEDEGRRAPSHCRRRCFRTEIKLMSQFVVGFANPSDPMDDFTAYE